MLADQGNRLGKLIMLHNMLRGRHHRAGGPAMIPHNASARNQNFERHEKVTCLPAYRDQLSLDSASTQSEQTRSGKLGAERALEALSCAVRTLFDWTNRRGRVDRRSHWLAVSLAASIVGVGYAMDWFLLGTASFAQPDFFACVAGTVLVLPLLTLGVRRLHDTDRSGWLMLFVCMPVVGWLLLTHWLCAPSVGGATPECSGKVRRLGLRAR
jgi:uncharacterized membrane protein YhaH (DUF805 family)